VGVSKGGEGFVEEVTEVIIAHVIDLCVKNLVLVIVLFPQGTADGHKVPLILPSDFNV
jgi:hypothetical protein